MHRADKTEIRLICKSAWFLPELTHGVLALLCQPSGSSQSSEKSKMETMKYYVMLIEIEEGWGLGQWQGMEAYHIGRYTLAINKPCPDSLHGHPTLMR